MKLIALVIRGFSSYGLQIHHLIQPIVRNPGGQFASCQPAYMSMRMM